MEEVVDLLGVESAAGSELGARRAHNDGHVRRAPRDVHAIDPVGERIELADAGLHAHVAVAVGAAQAHHRHLHVVLLAVAELCRVPQPEGERASLDGVEPVARDRAEVVPDPRQDVREVALYPARVGRRVEVPVGEEDVVWVSRVVRGHRVGADGAEGVCVEARRVVPAPGGGGEGVGQVHLHGSHVPRAVALPAGAAVRVVHAESEGVVGLVEELGREHVHERRVGRVGVAADVLALGEDGALEGGHPSVELVEAVDDGAAHPGVGRLGEDRPVGQVGGPPAAAVEVVEEVPSVDGLDRRGEGLLVALGRGRGRGQLEHAGDRRALEALPHHGVVVDRAEYAHESQRGDERQIVVRPWPAPPGPTLRGGLAALAASRGIRVRVLDEGHPGDVHPPLPVPGARRCLAWARGLGLAGVNPPRVRQALVPQVIHVLRLRVARTVAVHVVYAPVPQRGGRHLRQKPGVVEMRRRHGVDRVAAAAAALARRARHGGRRRRLVRRRRRVTANRGHRLAPAPVESRRTAAGTRVHVIVLLFAGVHVSPPVVGSQHFELGFPAHSAAVSIRPS
mmetsp:Transcript_25754/g.58772  ORF Transcript_25754/g.58772 Transcript_25754/m.58772 type:complete len:566 (+) Transcript_25754:1448-3145(+)